MDGGREGVYVVSWVEVRTTDTRESSRVVIGELKTSGLKIRKTKGFLFCFENQVAKFEWFKTRVK